LTRTVLVLGATGLFGGHLARRLIGAGHPVILSGRSRAALQAFAAAHGGTPLPFDRDDAEAAAAALATARPFAVIDAAGPFQAYGPDPYRFARQVLEGGVHYLDLADAADFVAGIGALDALARARGLVALSGASSTPALSAAAADALAEGLDRIEAVEAAILPGNRTDRGLSVIRAILAQVGQPYRQWRGGRWQTVHGWDDTRMIAFRAGGHALTRPGALNETPDVALFPARYRARTVVFRAGLELPVMHHGLSLARWLVRLGLIRSLAPLSRPALRAASVLKGFGSDRGGMTVAVLGRGPQGWERRSWDLVATDGIGPRVPAEPAALLVEKLLAGTVAPGARNAAGALTLAEAEAGLHALGLHTERRSAPAVPIFRQAVAGFDALPHAVRGLHDAPGLRRFEGSADIDGPEGWRAALLARLAGFPPPGRAVPVTVEIDADETREVWTRSFGRHRFRSVLTLRGGTVHERFGPAEFALGLTASGGALAYPVTGARLFGRLPMPAALIPVSETAETEDAEGRFRFDVLIRLRSGARIAHYRGWLVPVADDQP
jgi:NAD(P)-dependent dehydrogenase (short-subunit alcohol dehydrogenase family)